MKLHGSLNIKNDELCVGNITLSSIAREFGTPYFLMDENLIRENINKFKNSMGEQNKVVYAGKTFLNSHMIKILIDENIFLDVVSDGELFVAKNSGFNMENIIFHGNNKSYDEIKMGIEFSVGRFVVDSLDELNMISKISKELNKKTKVFLRINPGIEANTHEYIKTACVDCKFGIFNDKNQILNIVNSYRENKNIDIVGFHCHIGSQIFSNEPYIYEIDELFKLMSFLNEKINFTTYELNLGGGFGIYYTFGDRPLTIEEQIKFMLMRVSQNCENLNLNMPKIYVEPGRSIVGNAGTTVYEVGTVKEIQGVRNYVSVNGGMSDNIRTALYDAKYECSLVNRFGNENYKATITGKLCESGDILIKDVLIRKPERGDLLAIFSTGAYCHSMSSNYNKLRRPPVIFFYNDNLKLSSRRETLLDLIKLDV